MYLNLSYATITKVVNLSCPQRRRAEYLQDGGVNFGYSEADSGSDFYYRMHRVNSDYFNAGRYWGKNKGRSMEGMLVKLTRALVVLFIVISAVLNIGSFN